MQNEEYELPFTLIYTLKGKSSSSTKASFTFIGLIFCFFCFDGSHKQSNEFATILCHTVKLLLSHIASIF